MRIARCKHEQLFGKAAQNIQHRLLVGQEHIAPHGRIRRRDAGEIAKPRRGILDDFAVRHLRQMVGHAHHRIGDQVRRVADHRQHQIVVRGIHRIDLRAHRLQQRPQPRQRRGIRRRQPGSAATSGS